MSMHVILNADLNAQNWHNMNDTWETLVNVIDPDERYDEMARIVVRLADSFGGICGTACVLMTWECRDDMGTTVASETVHAFISLVDSDTFSVRFSWHNRTRAYREVASVYRSTDPFDFPEYVYDIVNR